MRTAIPLLAVTLLGCDLVESTLPGPQPARWGLRPDHSITAQTTEFVAQVTENDCASGRSSANRIVGPEIEYTADSVIVEFRVRPLGGAQSCQGNPSTPVRVVLDEPLGPRRLLDGGSDPPREPPVCVNEEFCE